jgi:membrane protein YdbS with pleckstrin-like domain
MFERFMNWLLRVIRVPPEPRPPASDRHVLRVFRAAPNFWRYKLALWLLKQAAALCGLVIGFTFVGLLEADTRFRTLGVILLGFEYLAWLIYLVQLPIGYALLRLDFDMRWYVLTDRSMHLREGTIRLNEKTITFANVQNITVQQNPLQRLLGIADVHVRTAGGGSSAGDPRHASSEMHEARFHGVDNPDEIRDAIRERVRLYRDAGLGDTDDPEHLLPAAPANALVAARDVLAEVRALRAAIVPQVK